MRIDYKNYQRYLNQSVGLYKSNSAVHRALADRLVDRCDLLVMKPGVVIDVGSRDGYVTQQLSEKYPDAELIAIEQDRAWFDAYKEDYPYKAIQRVALYDQFDRDIQPADLLVSSLTLTMLAEWRPCFERWLQALRPDGSLLFSCLGVDTLQELWQSFASVDTYPHVFEQPDMHHIGDALMASGFVDSVMHRDVITIYYDSLEALFNDLRLTGCYNLHLNRRKGLLTPRQWQRLIAHYNQLRDEKGRYPVTIEMIYGHAVAPSHAASSISSSSNEVCIPVDSIKVKQ